MKSVDSISSLLLVGVLAIGIVVALRMLDVTKKNDELLDLHISLAKTELDQRGGSADGNG